LLLTWKNDTINPDERWNAADVVGWLSGHHVLSGYASKGKLIKYIGGKV